MAAFLCSTCARKMLVRSINNLMTLKKIFPKASFSQMRTKSSSSMSAWMIHQYGGSEELSLSKTTAVPTIRSPDEILVEVHAASVNPIDVRMCGGYGQTMINLLRKQKGSLTTGAEFPLTLGRDFSGTVVETGKNVHKYKRGDEVWGAVGAHRQGSHAQLLITSDNEISRKPKSLDHVSAASIPYVAATSWAAISTVGEMKPSSVAGKRILITAGAGGIGTFSVQLLHAWGAHVTTACSTDAMELLYSLGADTVIDYKKQDVQSELNKLPRFDFILDTIGGKTGQFSVDLLQKWKMSRYVSLVTPAMKNADDYGIVKGTVKTTADVMKGITMGLMAGRSYRWAFFVPNGKALEQVARMVDDGKIQPVIDQTFSFEDVPKAFDKVKEGHARGKTVIKLK